MNARLILVLIALAAVATTVSAAYSVTTSSTLLQFASAAYCPASKLQSWKCAHCFPGFTPDTILSDTKTNIQGFVGVHTQQQRIILSFRGTVATSIANWVTDLKAAKVKNYDGVNGAKVHEGFLLAWQSVRTKTFDAVRALRSRYPNHKLAITGHSMGGALAVLAATDLSHNGVTVNEVYTYGAPRVGNSVFSQYFKGKISESYRIVNRDDIVPHVPTKFMGFLHTSSERWYRDGESYVSCNDSATAEDPKCSNSVLAPISIPAHMTYMGVKLGWGEC